MGRQWFNLTFRDAGELERGVKHAAPALNTFLDAELKRLGLGPRALALVGFSQGTMMALGVGLKRNPPPAAIVGYSGALATLEALPGGSGLGPAILLVHGDADQVIPVDAMFLAREQLAKAGLPVEWHVAEGIGHGIDAEGLRLGGAFLRQAFAATQTVT
jgi:phospholipase/carboxylesterase